MTQKVALLLSNPMSRSGNISLTEVIHYLTSNNIRVIHKYTDNSRSISFIINEHSKSVDLVIIGGGDGTLNSAARGLISSDLPLGILPLGTANDLARTLSIPDDLMQALAIITKGETTRIDVGSVNDILFFNASSIGLGVDVTRNLTGEVKNSWGILSYAHSVWHALKKNRSFRAKVVCDGKVSHIRSIQITVGNGRFYGGGMAIAADAAINDQRLDFYSLRPQPLWRLIFLAPFIRAGHFTDRRYTLALSGKQIDIYMRKEKSISTDGEITTQTPARYRLLPKAISVFVP